MIMEVWTLAEGSGVSRIQLETFARSADSSAQTMTGAVNNLDNNLQTLAASSKGSFAAMFAQVKIQMQDELARMNQALQATSVAANTAVAGFHAGDDEQSQTVRTAGDAVTGLSANLQV